MPGETAIEWTRGDDGTPGHTWNPVTGCTKVSAGCDRCYAERFAERWRGIPGHAYEQGFDLRLWPERLTLPLRWPKPTRIFVNSMSDLWHAEVPYAFIVQALAVMALAPRHTFMILTKRPRRMHTIMAERDLPLMVAAAAGLMIERGEARGACLDDADPNRWPLRNVWLGTSVEDQAAAFRIEWLVKTPAAVRFLSCEPLIGSLDVGRWLAPPCPNCGTPHLGYCEDPRPVLVDWVIAGGESGPGFRPVDPAWVRDLRDQCVAARVPFFFKQWGGIRSKAGGRELDGRTWDEMPEGKAA